MINTLFLCKAGVLSEKFRPPFQKRYTPINVYGGVQAGTSVYTEDAGLPYFDRAAVIANGNWYYPSALESMGANLCFCYCLVSIGPSYK